MEQVYALEAAMVQRRARERLKALETQGYPHMESKDRRALWEQLRADAGWDPKVSARVKRIIAARERAAEEQHGNDRNAG